MKGLYDKLQGEKLQPTPDGGKYLLRILNNYANDINQLINFLKSQNPIAYSDQRIANFDKVLDEIGMKSTYAPIITKKDENSLFYAISLVLFGNSDRYDDLKIGLAAILLKHEEFTRKLIGSDDTFENILYKCVKNKEWGTQYHILLLSVLLEKPIFVYTNNRLSFKYCMKRSFELKNPICILLIDKHYSALMPYLRHNLPVQPNYEHFKDQYFF
jgi:hypothetical protein